MFSAKKLSFVCASFGLTVLLSACGGGSEQAGTAASSTTSASAVVTTATITTTTAANSVAISWTPPTRNIDGTPLTDLNAYKIYYGTSADNLTDSVRVDANVSSYMMSGLISGTTYYFAITSMNTVGTESDLSNVASKTV